MKKILVLGLVLAFWAASALAQTGAAGTDAGNAGAEAGGEGVRAAGHGGQAHRGPRHRNHGATAPVPEDGDEITTTEATPYSNTDFAPWDNHLNVEAPVISIE